MLSVKLVISLDVSQALIKLSILHTVAAICRRSFTIQHTENRHCWKGALRLELEHRNKAVCVQVLVLLVVGFLLSMVIRERMLRI